MKTVRFAQVVARSGRPRVHTPWVAPEKDAEFRRAQKAHRVLTLEHRERGQAAAGRVGFAARHARGEQFLVFPKSLAPFEGRRVVGIKFDLVEQPKLVAAPHTLAANRSKRPKAPRGRPAKTAKAPSETGQARIVPFEPPAAARREAGNARPPHRGGEPASPLVREVRRALRELKAGKSVAAYERLARAVAKS